MRIRLVHNAASGYGKAQTIADEFARRLTDAGYKVGSKLVGPGQHGAFEGLFDADALVLIGGDGTVHHALPAAVEARVPIYQVPTGTENLFARDWAMDHQVETLLRALKSRRVQPVDLGVCDGRPFSLMCSVGFDAAIIHRRSSHARKGDGHRAYLMPVLEQLADPALPRLQIWVDGELVVDGRRGMCVIANSRQYAMRLDPAHKADPTDGLLDLVFLPCENSIAAAGWSVLAMFRQLSSDPAAIYRTGRTIVVHAPDGPAPCQIDGEPLGHWDDKPAEASLRREPTRLSISVHPASLHILDARPHSETPS